MTTRPPRHPDPSSLSVQGISRESAGESPGSEGVFPNRLPEPFPSPDLRKGAKGGKGVPTRPCENTPGNALSAHVERLPPPQPRPQLITHRKRLRTATGELARYSGVRFLTHHQRAPTCRLTCAKLASYAMRAGDSTRARPQSPDHRAAHNGLTHPRSCGSRRHSA